MNDKRKPWPVYHRVVFSFALAIALVCVIGMAGIAFAGEDSGVHTTMKGGCKVRILIQSDQGGFRMSPQSWTLTAPSGVAAYGTNHAAHVSVPAGHYVFASGGKSKSLRVGAVPENCKGNHVDTTIYGWSAK